MPKPERHLHLVPDPDVGRELIRTVIIDPPNLTTEQRRKRDDRMLRLGLAVERFRRPGETRP